MALNRQQWIGVGLTIIGFIIITLASLWLATEANLLSLPDVVLRGVVIFVAVSPLFLGGIYLYNRPDPQDMAQANTTSGMLQQRHLTDLLRAQPKMSLDQLANELNVDVSYVRGMIEELAQLALFSGYIHESAGQVHYLPSLTHIETCLVCGHAVMQLPTRQALCPQCETDYYLAQNP